MKNKLQNLISKGDTKGALEELMAIHQEDNSLFDEIIGIQSSFNQISNVKK